MTLREKRLAVTHLDGLRKSLLTTDEPETWNGEQAALSGGLGIVSKDNLCSTKTPLCSRVTEMQEVTKCFPFPAQSFPVSPGREMG